MFHLHHDHHDSPFSHEESPVGGNDAHVTTRHIPFLSASSALLFLFALHFLQVVYQCFPSTATMFDLHQFPSASAPIKRVQSSVRIRLSKDRFVPGDLPGEPADYLVDLTDEDDPANAKNWAFRRKMLAATILGFDTLVASWGSSVYSSAVEPVSMQFGVSSVVSILGLTLYICGFATGPLAFAPLSELYGRKWPITGACFIV